MNTRYLAIYANENGESKAVIVNVKSEDRLKLPFGVLDNTDLEEKIQTEFGDYNDGGGLVLVDIGLADFVPQVVDTLADQEVEIGQLNF